MNLKKADWTSYHNETELKFSTLPLPDSCSTGENIFRRVLLEAGRHHIPQGHIRNHIPNLTDSTKRLILERDNLRSSDPSHPNIHALDQQINKYISDSNRQKWIHSVESCSHKQNTTHFWSLLKSLSNKNNRPPPNQPITFGTKTLNRNLEIATAFTKQFTSVITHTSDPTARRVKRRLDRCCPLDRTSTPFTPLSVSQAIRQSGNSRAAGPDGITIHHLKHLGPTGLQYLTNLYNLSYTNADIPSIWKLAIVVPIQKPGKPAGLGSGYRPISLLSPAAKVLERLLLPELNNLPLSNFQHGFRPSHSTTTALLPHTHHIAASFNQNLPPSRAVTMSIDLSKAFDVVNHTKLITSLTNTTLRNNTKRWLSAYLRGRMASCRYNNTTSPCRHARTGVPQGSCISPVLFNFFVSTYPQSDLLTTSYADDFTDSSFNPDVTTAASALSDHAGRVVAWAEERGLALNPTKSTVTLFTPDKRRESHLHPTVTLNNTILPLNRNPRILGVTFDPHFTFSPHITSIINKASPRINILKALAGTTWGQQKETMIITFKSLIRSIFTYASPIWFPNSSASSINKLQSIQNSALRIATGCVKMSNIDHLHTETQVLPVKDHLSLLSTQFLAKALQPNHPSHPIVTSPSGPRNKKATLQSRFLCNLTPYLEGGVLQPDRYKSTIAQLHTTAVATSISNRSPNRVLQSSPPPISEEEVILPRIHRTTLAQLRSGFCSSLKDFQVAIHSTTNPLCPSCRQYPQTVSHLFSCSEHPTDLTTADLWHRPLQTSEFLQRLPFFNLPQISRPPPEPPP